MMGPALQRLMADEIAERYSSGLNDGLEQGRVEGMIELGSALNMSDAEILSTLQKQLNISEQQARAYLDKYRGK